VWDSKSERECNARVKRSPLNLKKTNPLQRSTLNKSQKLLGTPPKRSAKFKMMKKMKMKI